MLTTKENPACWSGMNYDCNCCLSVRPSDRYSNHNISSKHIVWHDRTAVGYPVSVTAQQDNAFLTAGPAYVTIGSTVAISW